MTLRICYYINPESPVATPPEFKSTFNQALIDRHDMVSQNSLGAIYS
jgi:hypothetical protein